MSVRDSDSLHLQPVGDLLRMQGIETTKTLANVHRRHHLDACAAPLEQQFPTRSSEMWNPEEKERERERSLYLSGPFASPTVRWSFADSDLVLKYAYAPNASRVVRPRGILVRGNFPRAIAGRAIRTLHHRTSFDIAWYRAIDTFEISQLGSLRANRSWKTISFC